MCVQCLEMSIYSLEEVAFDAFVIVCCILVVIMVCLVTLSCAGVREVDAIEEELKEKREQLHKATTEARQQADVIAEQSTKAALLVVKDSSVNSVN